jgi:hypothetical protein
MNTEDDNVLCDIKNMFSEEEQVKPIDHTSKILELGL